jgi:hypothetical protein
MLINVEIQGISALLCNRFHDAAALAVENGTSAVHGGKKGTPREQCELRLYRDTTGHCVLPGPNLFRSIIDAGTFIKSGKSKITTMRSSLVPAGVALLELELPIAPGKWEADSRAVVNPSTQGRMICHRPRFDEWRVKFTLDIDTTLFSPATVRELVDLAGSRIGVGDFRPARKGPFGRFKVTGWKIDKKS